MKKKVLLLVLMFSLLFSTAAFGHGITNEKTLYEDLKFTNIQKEMVFMRALGTISGEGSNLFRPQDTLTKEELGFFAARYHGLAGHSAPREEALELALENELVDSIEGNATYADVNHAYFEGKASVENPDNELTREELVVFLSRFFTETIDGQTLPEIRGWSAGPTGVVEVVDYEVLLDEGTPYKDYVVTIGGQTFPVNDHGRIYNGPVDLSAWEGKTVSESWLRDLSSGGQEFRVLVAAPGEFSDDEIANLEIDIPENELPQEDQDNGFPIMPIAGAVILIVVLAWLFLKKKK